MQKPPHSSPHYHQIIEAVPPLLRAQHILKTDWRCSLTGEFSGAFDRKQAFSWRCHLWDLSLIEVRPLNPCVLNPRSKNTVLYVLGKDVRDQGFDSRDVMVEINGSAKFERRYF